MGIDVCIPGWGAVDKSFWQMFFTTQPWLHLHRTNYVRELASLSGTLHAKIGRMVMQGNYQVAREMQAACTGWNVGRGTTKNLSPADYKAAEKNEEIYNMF